MYFNFVSSLFFKQGSIMKSIILFGLIVGLCVFYVPQTYAQTNTSKSVQSAGMSNLISILSNAPINVSPEQLQQDLVAAIENYL